jgi:hypothetical protein
MAYGDARPARPRAGDRGAPSLANPTAERLGLAGTSVEIRLRQMRTTNVESSRVINKPTPQINESSKGSEGAPVATQDACRRGVAERADSTRLDSIRLGSARDSTRLAGAKPHPCSHTIATARRWADSDAIGAS